MKKWSKKEVSILKNNINEDYPILVKLLPNWSLESIIDKKDRLGLKRKSKFFWSSEEDKYLIENYHKKPIQELSKKLNKTYDAIHAKRIRLINNGYKIKDKKKNDLLISNGWKLIRINENKLSKKEVENRCETLLRLIEKYKNFDEYNITNSLYI